MGVNVSGVQLFHKLKERKLDLSNAQGRVYSNLVSKKKKNQTRAINTIFEKNICQNILSKTELIWFLDVSLINS